MTTAKPKLNRRALLPRGDRPPRLIRAAGRAQPRRLFPSAAAPYVRTGGGRKQEGTKFKLLLRREGRKLGEGDSRGSEAVMGGKEGGGEWEGSVKD